MNIWNLIYGRKGKYTYFMFLCVLLTSSCRNDAEFTFEGNFVVQEQTFDNDSLIPTKNTDYFVSIEMKDSIQHWKKKYFYKEHTNLFGPPIAVVYDSSFYELKVNKNVEIIDFLNWKSFFAQYQKKGEEIVLTYPEEQRELLKAFIKQFSEDSLMICTKNLSSFHVINKGIHFISNATIPTKNQLLVDKGTYWELKEEELIPQENLTQTIDFLQDALNSSSAPDLKDLKPIKRIFIIQIDKETNNIKKASQTKITTIDGKTIRHVIEIQGVR
jgi:hypothetical protein